MEALIDQACRDVLPGVYLLPADPFYAEVAKLVILCGGLAKLEHVKARIAALNRSEVGNGVLVRLGIVKETYGRYRKEYFRRQDAAITSTDAAALQAALDRR